MTPRRSKATGHSCASTVVRATVLALVLSASVVGVASAENKWERKLADSIYLAEGGPKAAVPYGILSVPCDKDCRQVCINTIRNNLWRYLEATDQVEDYIRFLGSRYAPENASPLNRNWVPNVTKIYQNKGGALK